MREHRLPTIIIELLIIILTDSVLIIRFCSSQKNPPNPAEHWHCANDDEIIVQEPEFLQVIPLQRFEAIKYWLIKWVKLLDKLRLLVNISQYCPEYPEPQIQPLIVHTPPFLQGLILQSKVFKIKKKWTK